VPLQIIDRGENNHVEIAPDTMERSSGTILLKGSGTSVRIGHACLIQDCHMELDGECTVTFGPDGSSLNLFVWGGRGSCFEVGARVNFNARDRLLAHEPGCITIGHGSLFASDIDITVSDMHSIFDAATGDRLNQAKDVTIGEDVWVADRCTVMKGAEIGSGSVIGAASIVTGRIPPAALAAGVPARVIREGIRWTRELLPRLPGQESV
jgi:acetyltransferase-like isoleucine patch superfamily enzyme